MVDHYLLLGLILVALVLFVTEVIRPDLVSVGVLLTLLLLGFVDLSEAFSGFSNPAVITVAGMFILSAGLVHAGVADSIAQGILRVCGHRPALLTAASMSTAGVLSAFMNNIGAVAVMMPSMFTISKSANYPVSRLLIPLSFGSLLGGLLTLVGTPPNLMISMSLEEHGFTGFRFFDFAPTGLAVLVAGVLYMVFLGRMLIPDRQVEEDLTSQFQLGKYLTEILIPEGSSYVSQNLREAGLREKLGLNILRMRRERNGRVFWYMPGPESRIESGDRLIIQGDLEAVLKEKQAGNMEIFAERKFTESDLRGEGMELAEVVIAANSDLIGQSIRDFDARRSLNVLVLALKRGGDALRRNFAALPLQAGDVLLVQGSASSLSSLTTNPDFLVVSKVKPKLRNLRKAPLAIAILGGTVLLAATGILHISVAATLGALLMVLTRCLPIEEIYHSVDWRVIVLIAGMIPLGLAMDESHTGTARWLADLVLSRTGEAGPLLIMALLFLFATLITEIMSNAAAAVLIAPLSIAISNGMGIEPYPFLMAIAIGVSTTFLTPIGHQSNVLVYGVGNYRFSDFARVGALLNVIVFIVVLVVVPMVWPFRPL